MVNQNEYRKKQTRMLAIESTACSFKKEALKKTGRETQWKKEEQRRQFKRCNSTFGKQKMKSINKVEHKEEGVLVQVTTQDEVENAIMKENSTQFRLACSSLIFKDEMCKELDPSGEGRLAQDILGSQEQLY